MIGTFDPYDPYGTAYGPQAATGYGQPYNVPKAAMAETAYTPAQYGVHQWGPRQWGVSQWGISQWSPRQWLFRQPQTWIVRQPQWYYDLAQELGLLH